MYNYMFVTFVPLCPDTQQCVYLQKKRKAGLSNFRSLPVCWELNALWSDHIPEQIEFWGSVHWNHPSQHTTSPQLIYSVITFRVCSTTFHCYYRQCFIFIWIFTAALQGDCTATCHLSAILCLVRLVTPANHFAHSIRRPSFWGVSACQTSVPNVTCRLDRCSNGVRWHECCFHF